MHFLFIWVLRPAPPTYSLDAITSALGSGLALQELDVQFADPPPPSHQDERDRALGLALADRLGVEPSSVRVVLAKPSSGDRESSRAPEQVRVNDGVRHSVSAMGEMPDQIVGDFTAALRLNDGQWRVVRSASRAVDVQ